MSKEAFETHATRIGRRDGKRYAERRQLQVPWDLAIGHYEKLSDLQVREFLNDMLAEQLRREAAAATAVAVNNKCAGFDPWATQFKGES